MRLALAGVLVHAVAHAVLAHVAVVHHLPLAHVLIVHLHHLVVIHALHHAALAGPGLGGLWRRLFGRGVLRMVAVVFALRIGGAEVEGGDQAEGEQGIVFASVHVLLRHSSTRTSRNIPRSMCISRWQW
jgi:sterol desaturase/sphingolipid hydroxylase (fatty acid hydroxylase superfamily)